MTLPGSERYRVQQVLPVQDKLVAQANAMVPIYSVLKDEFNIRQPEDVVYKSYCPLGWEHPDGGVDKGWRTYPSSNSSYCFVMHGSLTPVRLIAVSKGMTNRRAAQWLLDRYVGPRFQSYQEKYEDLLQAHEKRSETVGQVSEVVEALHTALRCDERYVARQFDEDVMLVMEEILEALNELLRTHEDEATIRQWYVQARKTLLNTVAGE